MGGRKGGSEGGQDGTLIARVEGGRGEEEVSYEAAKEGRKIEGEEEERQRGGGTERERNE